MYVSGHMPEFGLLDTVPDALDRRFSVTIILDLRVVRIRLHGQRP